MSGVLGPTEPSSQGACQKYRFSGLPSPMGGKAGVGPAFGLLVCIAAVACDPLFPSLPLLPASCQNSVPPVYSDAGY